MKRLIFWIPVFLTYLFFLPGRLFVKSGSGCDYRHKLMTWFLFDGNISRKPFKPSPDAEERACGCW